MFVGIDIYVFCKNNEVNALNLPVQVYMLDSYNFDTMDLQNDEYCAITPTDQDEKGFHVYMEPHVRRIARIKTQIITTTSSCGLNSTKSVSKHSEEVLTSITEVNERLGLQYKMTWPSLEAEWSNLISGQSMDVIFDKTTKCQYLQHTRLYKVLVYPEASWARLSGYNNSNETSVHSLGR